MNLPNIRFDRDAERQFINVPQISDISGMIVKKAKARFSDPHYEQLEPSLLIVWRPSEALRASALKCENGTHEIRLSYGVAIEVYRDAFLLPETCERVLIDKAFDPIFDLLGYGNKRTEVLPAGISKFEAKMAIMEVSTQWIFLHEQAHLFQNHLEIANNRGASALGSHAEGIVDERENDSKLQGSDAALRHVFEFAADYEAVSTILLSEKLTETRLWCLTISLMCMFLRFYDKRLDTVEAFPVGSHPHPGVRMRMIANKVEDTLSRPELAGPLGWRGGAAQARRVMDHAIFTADVYWHLRYLGLESRTPFMDIATSLTEVPESYKKAVFDVWRSVRPDIVRNHLGHGEGVVMFWKNPAVVGSKLDVS